MHAVSLLVEVHASSAKQGKDALQKLSARADRVWACHCTDVSDSSLPPIFKLGGWQDCHPNLCQVKPQVTEVHQGGVGTLLGILVDLGY